MFFNNFSFLKKILKKYFFSLFNGAPSFSITTSLFLRERVGKVTAQFVGQMEQVGELLA